MDNDAVAVPGPLDWLRDPDVTFEVLIASKRNQGPGVVERIRVRAAEVFGLESNPDGSVALLRLERPSEHRPNAEILDTDKAEAALAANPDLWMVLEETGGLPAGIRELPVDAVLGPIVEWERERRAKLVRVRLGNPSDTVALRCCFWSGCQRCRKCPGNWW
ncbi:MAG: hypothetical protein M3Q39_15250 [Actinomycetota bacterium]|nr:hypothetical protein [Actinomycetota bacterium]